MLTALRIWLDSAKSNIGHPIGAKYNFWVWTVMDHANAGSKSWAESNHSRGGEIFHRFYYPAERQLHKVQNDQNDIIWETQNLSVTFVLFN